MVNDDPPPVDPALIKDADPWVKALFDRFDLVHRSVNSFGTDLQTVKKAQEEQAQKVDGLQNEQVQLRSDLTGVKDDVATLTANFEAYKETQEQRYRDLESKYEAKVSAIKVQVPMLAVVEQHSVQKQFDDLLKEAEGMSAIFVIGIVPGVRPSVSIRTLLDRHFSKYGGKLLPTPSTVKSCTRRFSVPVENVPEVKAVIRHYNLAIRYLGWWVTQDAPPALRMLYSTSYSFFKFIKDQFQILRRFRYEAEDGYATINGVPFTPVYLIPKKQTAWKKLGGLLTELVADFLDLDWVESACSRLTVPDTFHQRWFEIIEAAKSVEVTKSFEMAAIGKPAPSRPNVSAQSEGGTESHDTSASSSASSVDSEKTLQDSSNDDEDFDMNEDENLGGGCESLFDLLKRLCLLCVAFTRASCTHGRLFAFS